MQGKRLTVIHGYTASAQSHWFPWLKQQLENQGVEVQILSMPDSTHPTPDAWTHHITRQIGRHDAQQFFVAHSLGCIALLRHLERLDGDASVGGMLLVSGFATPLPNLPELTPFTQMPLDSGSVIDRVAQRTVLASLDDTVVPAAHSLALSQQLQARWCTQAHGGHFLASDGFSQFPLLLQELQAMMHTPL